MHLLHLTLDNLLSKARSLKASEIQAVGIEKSLPHIPSSESLLNHIHTEKESRSSANSKECRNCGLKWPHKNGPCPAKGRTCNKCGKPNHFARVCRLKLNSNGDRSTSYRQSTQQREKSHVHQVNTESLEISSSSDDEYLYTLEQDKTRKVSCGGCEGE